jgi:flagella basal body P-ring formation protein FlgA
MIIKWKCAWLGLLCILASGVNAEIQSQESIEHTAYMYVFQRVQAQYENAQVSMEPIDDRLRLQTCDSHLIAFTQDNKIKLGKQTIGVKCLSPVAWTVYVPVKVKLFRPVVVSARALAGGHIITAADVKLEARDIASFNRGYMKKMKNIIGQQLKYPLARGTVINPNNLKPQKVIGRGDVIMLIAVAGQMEVRMSGTALSDGVVGERVRVKNISSKRVVEGVVDGPGIVRVTL